MGSVAAFQAASCEFKSRLPPGGPLPEWQGGGLQNRLRRFESDTGLLQAGSSVVKHWFKSCCSDCVVP